MTSCSHDESVARIVGQIADEYTERLNQGERPDISEYTSRHPELSTILRDALRALEWVRDSRAGTATYEQESGLIRTVSDLGDFRILREIGRGGMGIVYEATQISLDRRVALKVLPLAGVLDERQLQRFKSEARAAAGLHHTNIVPVFAVGCERGVHYYAMQFIDGCTLADIIRLRLQKVDSETNQSTPLNDAETVPLAWLSTANSSPTEYARQIARLGTQVAEALEYAHRLGVVHRDIKPSNLLLDHSGTVWIADFGLAQIETNAAMTMTGDIVGTLRYMSPEQAVGERGIVDQRADVYSLGVTLYELLALRPPFEAGGRAELLRQIMAGDVLPLRRHAPQIPAKLEVIVHKALSREPTDRYRTAQEFADDLRRFLEDKPIRARPPTLLESAERWVKRHRSVAWSSAGVAAVILLTLAFATWWVSLERAEAVRQRNATAHERNQAAHQRDLVMAREETLRRHLYVGEMRIAAEAAPSENSFQIRPILARHVPRAGQPDYRNFAWHYLNAWDELVQRTSEESLIMRGHGGGTHYVAVSPDDSIVASTSNDGTARLWNAHTGKHLQTLTGHGAEVNCAAFTADGLHVATAGDDKTVHVWKVATGELLWKLTDFQIPVHRLLFSNDGTYLAVGEADIHTRKAVTTVWEVASKTRIHRWEQELLLTLNPGSGQIVTSNGSREILIRELVSGRVLSTLRGHRNADPNVVLKAGFSPDGKKLISGDLWSTIIIWNMETMTETAQFHALDAQLRTMVVSPDGRFVAVGGNDRIVRIWRLLGRSLYSVINPNQGLIVSLAFSHDGKYLYSCGAEGTVRKWSLAQAAPHTCLPEHDKPASSISLSADGKLLAVTDDSPKVLLWDVRRAVALNSLSIGNHNGESKPSTVAFSTVQAHEVYVGSTAGDVHQFDARSGKELARWHCHDHGIATITHSRDGRLLSTTDNTGSTRVWEVASRSMRYEVPEPNVECAEFSNDTHQLIALSKENAVSHRISGGIARRVPVHGEFISAAFSSGAGLLARGSRAKSIKVWDLLSNRAPTTLFGHSTAVYTIAFSPDSQCLASGSWSGEIKLWDLETGQELFDLPGHSGAVTKIVFSADGQTLASAGETPDGRGEIWLWFAPHLPAALSVE